MYVEYGVAIERRCERIYNEIVWHLQIYTVEPLRYSNLNGCLFNGVLVVGCVGCSFCMHRRHKTYTTVLLKINVMLLYLQPSTVIFGLIPCSLFYIFGKESGCFARVGGVPAKVAL